MRGRPSCSGPASKSATQRFADKGPMKVLRKEASCSTSGTSMGSNSGGTSSRQAVQTDSKPADSIGAHPPQAARAARNIEMKKGLRIIVQWAGNRETVNFPAEKMDAAEARRGSSPVVPLRG